MLQSFLPGGLKALSTICALLFIAICSYYLVKSFLYKRERNSIILILLFMTFSYVLSYILSPMKDLGFNLIKTYALANFIFFPVYYLSKKNIITTYHLKFVFLFGFIFLVFEYFKNAQALYMARLIDSYDNVNNSGYNLLCILPMLFFYKNKFFKYICFALIAYLIVSSYKRGAIITFTVSCIPIFTLFVTEIKESKTSKFTYFIIFAVLIGSFANNIIEFISENDYLIERFQSISEGNSSGRDRLVTKALSVYFEEDSLLRYLFGAGLASTFYFAGNYAHNDWVETLVNQGLFGFVCLIVFYYSIFKIYRKEQASPYKHIMFMTFIILFLRTVFSMSFANPYSTFLIICVAFISGKQNSEVTKSHLLQKNKIKDVK